MKKSISLLLCFCIITSILMMTPFAQSQQTIKVIVDPKIMLNWNGDVFYPTESDGSTVYPITYNSRTYLPARFIAERAGVTVKWDSKTQTVAFTSGGTVMINNGKSPTTSENKYAAMAVMNPNISLKWDGAIFQPKDSNGTNIYPIIYKGRTYLPARFTAEKAGVEVLWDAEIQTVMFSTDVSGSPDKDGQNINNTNNTRIATNQSDIYASKDARFTTALWSADCIINDIHVKVPISSVYDSDDGWQFSINSNEMMFNKDPLEYNYAAVIRFNKSIKNIKTPTEIDLTKEGEITLWQADIYKDIVSNQDTKQSRLKEVKLALDNYTGENGLCTGYLSFIFESTTSQTIRFEGYFAVIINGDSPVLNAEEVVLGPVDTNTTQNSSNDNTDTSTRQDPNNSELDSNSTYNPPVLIPPMPTIIRTDNKICPDCYGRGRKTCIICDGTGDSNSGSIFGCPVCKGSGTQPCVRCGGDGFSMW